jgi:hypothetical protein
MALMFNAVAIHVATVWASGRPARPSVAGRSAGDPAVPPHRSILCLPSMEELQRLRIARPGHPWPGVRRRASQ